MNPCIKKNNGFADTGEMHNLWSLSLGGDLEARKLFLANIRSWLEVWSKGHLPPWLQDDFVAEAWPQIYFKLREFNPERGTIWTWMTWLARESARTTRVASTAVNFGRREYNARFAVGNGSGVFVALSSPGTVDRDVREVADVAFATVSDLPSHEAERADSCEAVRQLMARLSDRQRYVVSQYFGVGVAARRTSSELATEMNVSRQAVEQIIKEALGKLRGRAVCEELA